VLACEIRQRVFQFQVRKACHDADFLNRYTTKIANGLENTVPFQTDIQELRFNKDIFAPTMRLLTAMRSYHNDQDEKTQLVYDFFNQNFDKRSAQISYHSFGDSVQTLSLTHTAKEQFIYW